MIVALMVVGAYAYGYLDGRSAGQSQGIRMMRDALVEVARAESQ